VSSDTTQPTFHLFVFGTLRKDLGLHKYMEQCAELDSGAVGTTQGEMFSFHGGYPVVDFYGEGEVTGEVYLVNQYAEAFRSLHSMECGAGYTPIEIEVEIDDDEPILCVTYHWKYAVDHLDRVPSGDWKVHTEDHGTNRAMFTSRTTRT
jgi:gamma-glutamylcyclotransferase (GGCT)/AIG2-like uncharacterized protein YtfP